MQFNYAKPFVKQVTPSRYRTEMSLSTEERYKKLKNPLRKVRLFNYSNEWPFHINPDTIVFQNVKINTIATLPLTVTNKDSVNSLGQLHYHN